MLRKIRIACALLFFALVTLLFLDFTGTIHRWFGWMAKIQFLPAVLALNVGVVAALVVCTLLFGRLYCSVVCPLGVMQDLFGRAGRIGKKRRNRYAYTPARTVLRVAMLLLFVGLLVAGLLSAAMLAAPYSAYGRIAQNLFAPLYGWGNNLLAHLAERADSYAFYRTEVWVRSLPVFAVAVVTFVGIGLLAWRGGRTWCNTVCPVGTVLGALARFSWFRPVIDPSKCNGCGLCARRCKAACIDSKAHAIDLSRCVVCFDCLDNCRQGAIRYERRRAAETEPASRAADKTAADKMNAASEAVDTGRRSFLTGLGLFAAATAARAQHKKVDGGLAVLLQKRAPHRAVPIVPPGAESLRHLTQHCTGCQLCVAACPNGVLRPATAIDRLMQPEASYERGHCRPECTRCSEVCPTGAIRRVTAAEKSSVQIGHAVWVPQNCVPLAKGDACGNCARHCPTGAIRMVPSDAADAASPRIPAVDTERCIGCGACEHLCPARPFSAIYVEGHERHSII